MSDLKETADERGAAGAGPAEGRPYANLVRVLDDLASVSPDKPALFLPPDRGRSLAGREPLTFARVLNLVDRLAGAFRARGITKGDRVVVMVPMSPELYVVMLALERLAATSVLIEPGMGIARMTQCCELSSPKAIVGGPRAYTLRLLSGAFRGVPQWFSPSRARFPGQESLPALIAEEHPRVESESPGEEVPAWVTFTTGSTGEPRAIGRTHGFLWAQHLALAHAYSHEPTDVDLCAFPLFVHHTLMLGLSTVLPAMRKASPGSGVPEVIVRQIREHGVTTVRGAPAFFEVLTRYCGPRNVHFEGVRALFTGGAPVRPALVEAMRRLAPNGEAFVVYGSSEAEPISAIDATEVIEHTQRLTADGWGTCVGRPIGLTRIKILRGDEAPSKAPSAVGEVAVAGDHVSKSYFQDPEATAATKLADDAGTVWHRTGDTGYFDGEGRLWLAGRVSNKVTLDGQELHPLQVEPVVEALPFVSRCALLGISDPERGEKPLLVIEPTPRSLWARLTRGRRWRRAVLDLCARRGIPVRDVRFIGTVPLDHRHRAKTDYDRLKAWLQRPALLRVL